MGEPHDVDGILEREKVAFNTPISDVRFDLGTGPAGRAGPFISSDLGVMIVKGGLEQDIDVHSAARVGDKYRLDLTATFKTTHNVNVHDGPVVRFGQGGDLVIKHEDTAQKPLTSLARSLQDLDDVTGTCTISGAASKRPTMTCHFSAAVAAAPVDKAIAESATELQANGVSLPQQLPASTP